MEYLETASSAVRALMGMGCFKMKPMSKKEKTAQTALGLMTTYYTYMKMSNGDAVYLKCEATSIDAARDFFDYLKKTKKKFRKGVVEEVYKR